MLPKNASILLSIFGNIASDLQSVLGGSMSYRLIDFLNSDDAILFTILAKNLKEKYACVCKVRLSEFLYSTQQEGSKEF